MNYDNELDHYDKIDLPLKQNFIFLNYLKKKNLREK